MTNKEAIDKWIIPAINKVWNDKRCQEILEALEQEPCEDAISRQAVLDITWEEPSYADPLNVLTEVRDKVNDLSPVTPRPKTGHWIRELIRNEKGGCIGAKMICSECGNDNKHDEYMNYCPNCGFRMIEPQERSGEE